MLIWFSKLSSSELSTTLIYENFVSTTLAKPKSHILISMPWPFIKILLGVKSLWITDPECKYLILNYKIITHMRFDTKWTLRHLFAKRFLPFEIIFSSQYHSILLQCIFYQNHLLIDCMGSLLLSMKQRLNDDNFLAILFLLVFFLFKTHLKKHWLFSLLPRIGLFFC